MKRKEQLDKGLHVLLHRTIAREESKPGSGGNKRGDVAHRGDIYKDMESHTTTKSPQRLTQRTWRGLTAGSG